MRPLLNQSRHVSLLIIDADAGPTWQKILEGPGSLPQAVNHQSWCWPHLAKCFDEHTLACPALACDDIQAGQEGDLLRLDECKVPGSRGGPGLSAGRGRGFSSLPLVLHAPHQNATQHEADAVQPWQPAKQQALAACARDASPGRHSDTNSLDGKLLQICPIDGLLGSVQLRGGFWVKLL